MNIITSLLLLFVLAFGIQVDAGDHVPDHEHEPNTSPMERNNEYGTTKYKVRIFASTDQFVLQDCIENDYDTDGFHMGNIKGTKKLIMFCGHRPDRIGKYVEYTVKIGI